MEIEFQRHPSCFIRNEITLIWLHSFSFGFSFCLLTLSSSSSAAQQVPELETLLLAYLDDHGADAQIADSMEWLTQQGKQDQHEVRDIQHSIGTERCRLNIFDENNKCLIDLSPQSTFPLLSLFTFRFLFIRNLLVSYWVFLVLNTSSSLLLIILVLAWVMKVWIMLRREVLNIKYGQSYPVTAPLRQQRVSRQRLVKAYSS